LKDSVKWLLWKMNPVFEKIFEKVRNSE